jgi:homospermidine synthase
MWHGSQLGIDEARRLIPGESATSLQVVSSMLGAMVWALENPNRGYVEPEEIDHKVVLQYADPYLGPIPYVWTEWKPNQDKNSLFYREYDASNPLSFENFRVWT